jgi:hypothetical protein
MTALEIRPEEIGTYSYERYREIRARMMAVPRQNTPAPKPASGINAHIVQSAAPRIYPVPVGPSRTFSSPPKPRIKIRDIVNIVAHVYGVPVNCILSRRRAISVTRPRQEVMWLAKKFTQLSLPEIGRAMGKDHTTVLHAINKIDSLIANAGYEAKADAYVADWQAYLVERERMAPKPVPIPITPQPPRPPATSTPMMWTHAEKEQVRALLAAGWLPSRLAAKLGRSKSSLRNAIRRHRLDQPAAPALIAAE